MSEVEKLKKYANRPGACESMVPEEMAVQSCSGWYDRAIELAVEVDRLRATLPGPAEEAEEARRFRLIRSAYANEYRLRDSVRAEMSEHAQRGCLWTNGNCKDWAAYTRAIELREKLVEELASSPATGSIEGKS
jgi:hypothetical protein